MISIFRWLMADLVKSHTEGKKSTFHFSYSAAVIRGSQVTTELRFTVAYNHCHSWKTINSLYNKWKFLTYSATFIEQIAYSKHFSCVFVGVLIRVKTIEQEKLLLCYIWITYRSRFSRHNLTLFAECWCSISSFFAYSQVMRRNAPTEY